VLSELEQKITKFLYTNDLNAQVDTEGGAVISCYLLWEAGIESIDGLKQRISKLIADLSSNGYISDGHVLYIAIEVLLVNSKWSVHQISMDDLIQHLLQQPVVGHVVCGVSDDAASTCALEALLKYYSTISLLNPILHGNINCFIAAESNDNFLGKNTFTCLLFNVSLTYLLIY